MVLEPKAGDRAMQVQCSLDFSRATKAFQNWFRGNLFGYSWSVHYCLWFCERFGTVARWVCACVGDFKSGSKHVSDVRYVFTSIMEPQGTTILLNVERIHVSVETTGITIAKLVSECLTSPHIGFMQILYLMYGGGQCGINRQVANVPATYCHSSIALS